MITSIGVGFQSRLFSSQSFFDFKSFLIIFDWLEKTLDKKPAMRGYL